MTSNDFEPLWTARDVAAFLQIAEKTVRNKVSLDQIPYVKVGGSLRFRRGEIERWIIEQTAAADDVEAA